MAATNTIENTIFRFKFTPEFTGDLLSFSKLHQFDDRVTYKEAWTIWVRNNDDLIESECRRMKQIGYDGNVLDKMYKSGRYYFRKKTTQEPKKRRKYVSIDKDVIEAMDNHILNNYGTPLFKPSSSHEVFCNEYVDLVQYEFTRLFDEQLTKDDIVNKIKKTYKNRYFLFAQHNQTRNRDDNSIMSDITED